MRNIEKAKKNTYIVVAFLLIIIMGMFTACGNNSNGIDSQVSSDGIDAGDTGESGDAESALQATSYEYLVVEEYNDNGQSKKRLVGFNFPPNYNPDSVVIPKDISQIHIGGSGFKIAIAGFTPTEDQMKNLFYTRWFAFEEGSVLEEMDGLNINTDYIGSKQTELKLPDTCSSISMNTDILDLNSSGWVKKLICGKNTCNIDALSKILDITMSDYRFESDESVNEAKKLSISNETLRFAGTIITKDEKEAVEMAIYVDRINNSPENKYWDFDIMIQIGEKGKPILWEELLVSEGISFSMEDYIENYLELSDAKVSICQSYDYSGPGLVDVAIKNNGDKTVNLIEVTVYFKDDKGAYCAERTYTIFNTQFFFDRNEPLKPNYSWQQPSDKFMKIESLTSDIDITNYEVKITKVEFGEW